MSYRSYLESLVSQNEILIVSTISSGTDDVPNEHEDIDQYDPYAVPSEIPC